MAQKHRHHNNNRPKGRAAAPAITRAPIVAPEKKIPVQYAKPIIVLEDEQRNTFIYKAGQWVAHAKTIAECRLDCLVKELPQKVNGRTRYEVCTPLPVGA